MQEEWRQVVGFEGLYSVSNLGRVRSEEREVPGKLGSTRLLPEKELSLCLQHGRRFLVGFRKNGERSNHFVHRLVAGSFIPNPNGKPEVNHIDNNPLNNRVDNLEWVTHKENMEHSAKQGRQSYPKPTHVRATPERLAVVAEMIAQGVSYKEISRTLKICRTTIRKHFGLKNERTD